MVFDEEPKLEKSQIHREHMERVKVRINAEEEAFKLSRTIQEGDSKNYRKESFFVRKKVFKLSDEEMLTVTRIYQLLSGILALAGTVMIIMSISDPRALWPIYERSIKEMNWLWPGLVLSIVGVVAKIWFQYKHDKICDRIMDEYHAKYN
ncbi:MAG: hypothetical protein FWC15_06485 [Fibromonadales bacterium]|nr:hypothetical protein [Fibromonadales bacterium]